jgi:hypothetical protein
MRHALTLTREMYIPAKATKIADKLSDATAYLYTSNSEQPAAMVFHGKAQKPDWTMRFTSEASREKAITRFFQGRRETLGRKKAEKENTFKVGDILDTCWGYDQTNREWFEVVEVKGQWLVLREIAGKRSVDGRDRGQTVPMHGQYIGEPIRRMAKGSGCRIDKVRYASKARTQNVGGVNIVQPVRWSSYA